MKSAAEVVKDILVDASQGVFGTSVFVSHEPSNPDECITLYDNVGIIGEHIEASVSPWSQPRVQVRVRGFGYKDVFTRVHTLIKIIANKGMFFQDPDDSGEVAIRWHSFKIVNGPIHLELDTKKRDIFVANIRASREEVTI